MAVRGDLRVNPNRLLRRGRGGAPRKNVRRLMPFGVLAVAIAVYAVYAGFRAYRASRPYEWSAPSRRGRSRSVRGPVDG